jgi:serine/threonine-protein kinase
MRTSAAGSMADDALPLLPDGTTVGNWRVLELLGSGGMGEVYRAVRDDGLYEQTVALKLIRSTSAEHLRRFELERQRLAQLDHPGVSRIIDGGTATYGRPFMVMEYVEGEAIADYVRRTGAGPAATVSLVERLCEAVAHAHSRLVLHQDIKPVNVLVDASGQPRLIDFGIAITLSEQQESAVLAMTPGYAAPEQLRGESLSVAVDIFAIGVLLCELLTGSRPERTADGGVRIDSAGLADADLRAIVRRATATNASDRYPTVELLMADLRAWRELRPVSARRAEPGWRRYRLRRFLVRHRLGTSAAALLVLVLAGGVAATLWQARVANQNARQAEQVTEFMVQLFEGSDPTKGRDGSITAREMLDQGFETIGRELQEQPVVRARMLSIIGKVYQNLGLYERAYPALVDATAALREVGDRSWRYSSSLLYLANLEFRLNNLDAAESAALEALDVSEAYFGPDHPDVAGVLNTLALIYDGQERSDESQALLRRTIEIRRQHPEQKQNLAANLNNLALSLRASGKLDEAEPLLDEAAVIVADLYGREHPFMAYLLNGRAGLHEDRGDFDKAESDLREALAIAEIVFDGEHPFVAVVYYNLGRLFETAGDPLLALQHYSQALDIRQRILPGDNPDIIVAREAVQRLESASN